MLPIVKDEIEITLKGHLFKFRRMTWRDTIGQPRNRTELLATALVEVSGRPIIYKDGLKIIGALPIPIQERLHTIFIGSQDQRRLFSVTTPWSAPDALDYSAALAKEEEAKDLDIDAASKAFAEKFGQAALEEERAISDKIVKQSGYKGAILQTKADAEEVE